jgi:hypothetical protein
MPPNIAVVMNGWPDEMTPISEQRGMILYIVNKFRMTHLLWIIHGHMVFDLIGFTLKGAS